MSKIEFTVYGRSVPMARPRVVRGKDGRSHTFNPQNCTDWKQSIALQALPHRPKELLKGALEIDCVFYLLKPKSAPKKRLYPTGKPDIENYSKALLDALEGIMYANDSQIVTLRALKAYDDPPRVVVILKELEATSHDERH